eukprot:TRINITY_DN2263_c0_g2_i2.p1 TRINITY_DN2263_c0_g2~~TRINITY_DN2263_c0_g2_i2.p1  ORF type:complete len:846 (-),score=118.11 TRINITY_DN2263_c0_g2_i2:1033-3570(-)
MTCIVSICVELSERPSGGAGGAEVQGADQLHEVAVTSAEDPTTAPPPAKRAKTDHDEFKRDIEASLDGLEKVSRSVGLNESELILGSELVPLLLDSPHRSIHALVRRLAKSILLPSGEVPFDCVVNMVGPLFSQPLLDDLKTRISILTWNAVVLPLIQPQAAMRTLYQVYFRLLTTASHPKLQLFAAQILFRITRKADVTVSRIATLTKLRDSQSTAAGAADLPALQLQLASSSVAVFNELLSVYAEYRPDLLPMDVANAGDVSSMQPQSKPSATSPRSWRSPPPAPLRPKTRQYSVLACPDVDMWTTITAHTAASSPPEPIPSGLAKQLSIERSWSLGEHHHSAVKPATKLTAMQTISGSSPAHHISFSGAELARFEALVRKVGEGNMHDSTEESIRKIASVVDSRWLQHWLMLDANETAVQRITQWSQSLLDSLFKTPSADLMANPALLDAEQRHALQALGVLSETLLESPPSVLSFLRDFLRSWNGKSHFPEIMRLVRWLPPLPWEDLYRSILRPLGKVFFTLPSDFKATVLECFTHMLRSWLRTDWNGYHRFFAGQSRRKKFDLGFTLNPVESMSVDFNRTLYEFIRYVDQLASLSLLSETTSPNSSITDPVGVQQAILDFFDLVSRLHSRFALPFVVTPSPAIVYRCLLSSNAAALSRICGILARYKAEFDKLKTVMSPAADSTMVSSDTSSVPLAFPNGAEKIVVLNCYIWMFCGALWRSRLFIPPPEFLRDDLRLPQSILDKIRFEGISNCLGLTHAPSMLSLAKEYLEALQQATPAVPDHHVNPELIKDVVKEHYVDYLQQRRLTGLHHFLFSFIAALVRLQTQNTHPPSALPSTPQ